MARFDHFHRPLRWTAAALALAALVATTPATAQVDETLTLRVNDAEGVPGGIVAVVLRTYSSRSIGQGQICLRAPARLAGLQAVDGEPFAELLASYVFSVADDARRRTSFQGGGVQVVDMKFGSLTAGINEVDGPLAVFYFRLADTLIPGQEFELVLDIADTFLLDGDGEPIPVEGAEGRLRVRSPVAPREAGSSAEDTVPGQDAFLGLATKEPFRLSGGQVGLLYDDTFAAGPPEVFVDPRYGQAAVSWDDSVEGLLLIEFSSPDASHNRLPGEIVSVRVPTRADVPLGTQVPIGIDPALTFLLDRNGQPLDLALEADVLEFVPPGD